MSHHESTSTGMAREPLAMMPTEDPSLKSGCWERGWSFGTLVRKQEYKSFFYGSEPIRRFHFNQSLVLHIEDSNLGRGAKSVLDAAEDARLVDGISLHVQDCIDDVLKSTRSRQVAVLCNMSGNEHGGVQRLGQLLETRCADAHLRDGTGS